MRMITIQEKILKKRIFQRCSGHTNIKKEAEIAVDKVEYIKTFYSFKQNEYILQIINFIISFNQIALFLILTKSRNAENVFVIFALTSSITSASACKRSSSFVKKWLKWQTHVGVAYNFSDHSHTLKELLVHFWYTSMYERTSVYTELCYCNFFLKNFSCFFSAVLIALPKLKKLC